MEDVSKREARKLAELKRIVLKEEERKKIKQVRRILKKEPFDRTEDEIKILCQMPDVADLVKNRIDKHLCLKERVKEVVDVSDVLDAKCEQLANAIKNSKSLVVYTGAGISTAAQIPDYRGPYGVWTLLQKGKEVKFQDLSSAEPTFTHMALSLLYKKLLVSHIISQNCDGLHLRSGFPRKSLSEVHGNMYIEVCAKCKPIRQYIRLFDVTEKTGLHRHKTGRFCHKCGEELIDTIVHFRERGRLRWPLNWEGAGKAVEKADAILCLGSSLKVLKRYHILWGTDRPASQRPQLYIVNLQWTPKDSQSTLKINGKCDDVMRRVMYHLNLTVPNYNKKEDPIFSLATALLPEEEDTKTRKILRENHPQAPSDSEILRHTSVFYDHSYARNSESAPLELKIELKPDMDSLCSPASIHCASADNPCDIFSASDEKPSLISASDIETEAAKGISSEDFDDADSCSQNDITVSENAKLAGWYGKGYAKWKKAKRRKL